MTLDTKRKSNRKFFSVITLILLLLGAGAVFVLFFEGSKPVVVLDNPQTYLGKNGEIRYRVNDSDSGIRSITVSGEQGENGKVFHREEFSRASYGGAAGPLVKEGTVSFDIGAEGFKDGEITIVVEATDFSWRGWFQGNRTLLRKTVIIDTVPPTLRVLHSQRYIRPGGSGIAIYRLDDAQSRHGVSLNGRFHPGFLVDDGREDTYIACFALPYDSHQANDLQVVASDPAGNTSTVPFNTVILKVSRKRDKLSISDGFLEAKIPEFEQHQQGMTGNNLEKYLHVNQALRAENNNFIRRLCAEPSPQRHWREKFQRMPGSNRAGFADHRTYYHNGRVIDEQVHLGVDIASTRQADVMAANAGKVIFADYLGLYGNSVVVDHGQGIFSLYSHLSQLNVKTGDFVDQKKVLGLTGSSGMAGGDHLHFSMLVNGEFVTPLEWWDQHWLDDNIAKPLTDSKS